MRGVDIDEQFRLTETVFSYTQVLGELDPNIFRQEAGFALEKVLMKIAVVTTTSYACGLQGALGPD